MKRTPLSTSRDLNPIEGKYNNAIQKHRGWPNPQNPFTMFNIGGKKMKSSSGDKKSTKLETVSDNVCLHKFKY